MFGKCLLRDLTIYFVSLITSLIVKKPTKSLSLNQNREWVQHNNHNFYNKIILFNKQNSYQWSQYRRFSHSDLWNFYYKFFASGYTENILFFNKTFLLADISIEIVLEMPFFALSNVDIWFAKKKFAWISYITSKNLPTTQKMKLINKKLFAKVAQMRIPKLLWYI